MNVSSCPEFAAQGPSASGTAQADMQRIPCGDAQVATAMLADMLRGLSFPRLLNATRAADPSLGAAAAAAASLRQVAALAGIWERAAAAAKAQVCQPLVRPSR